MNRRYWLWFVFPLLVFLPLTSYAAGKPEITQVNAEFLDNMVNINVHWQSPNPVVLIKVLAGKEQKEIKVDEYANKRNPRGYSGEATAVLNAEPRMGINFITYVIYLEDDLNQKSAQRSGKVKVPETAMAAQSYPPGSVQVGVQTQVGVQMGTPSGDQSGTMGTSLIPMSPPPASTSPPTTTSTPMSGWTSSTTSAPAPASTSPPTTTSAPTSGWTSSITSPPATDTQSQSGMGISQPGFQIGMQPAGGNVQSQHPGGTIGEVLAVMERHDTPPYLQKLTINRYQGNNVSISTKAIDDKGLKEITFRIFDAAGTQVQDQTLSNLGKIWQGTSKTFQLSAGRYKAVGQAVDTAGNTSQEQSVTFEVTGSQVVPSAPATPSTTSVPQASTDSSESAASTSK